MTALLGIFIGRLAMVEKISNSTISSLKCKLHAYTLFDCMHLLVRHYMAGSGERSSVDLQIDLFVNNLQRKFFLLH